MADAVEACGKHPTWVRRAFDELKKGGTFVLDELPEIGLVISRLSA